MAARLPLLSTVATMRSASSATAERMVIVDPAAPETLPASAAGERRDVAMERVLSNLRLDLEVVDHAWQPVRESNTGADLGEQVAVLPATLLGEHVVGERDVSVDRGVVTRAICHRGSKPHDQDSKDR